MLWNFWVYIYGSSRSRTIRSALEIFVYFVRMHYKYVPYLLTPAPNAYLCSYYCGFDGNFWIYMTTLSRHHSSKHPDARIDSLFFELNRNRISEYNDLWIVEWLHWEHTPQMKEHSCSWSFSTMSRNEFHSNNLPQAMDTLDLHGFTKSDAISRTTNFLDRSNRLLSSENAWVLIITGSGAHSSQGRKSF